MSDALSLSWLELPDGSRFDLRGSTTVGRASENALALAGKEVSRRHALIQAQGEGEFWLVDLGSANGCWVNERRISQPVELKAGDVIDLADVRLVFRSERIMADHPSASGLLESTILTVKTAQCWMLMADIIGSTRLAQQMSAEELPRITGGWFKECREIIDECGGHVMKYLGDGFFCYWIAGPESPAQLSAVLDALKSMQEKKSPPFRIVVHYGEAAMGSVPTMAEINLHGAEVNFAFRMEKVAARLRQPVLFSETAAEEIGVLTWRIDECEVEGFAGARPFFVPGLPQA